MNHRIFVEGLNDKGLVRDIVRQFYSEEMEIGEHLIDVRGKDNLRNNNKLRQTIGTNLIIFDADNDATEARADIRNQLALKGITNYAIFLFPDNSPDAIGVVEDLLSRIIAENKRRILGCWTQYETCLNGIEVEIRDINNQVFTNPHPKSKIYSYLEILHGKSKSEKEKVKDGNRDFSNPNFWNLNSPELTPLLDFLDNYLTRK